MSLQQILSYTAIVGSRQLPPEAAGAVKEIVAGILSDPRAGIVSGGAMGADHFAIRALLELSQSPRGLIVTPWSGFAGFPSSIRSDIERFAAEGGQIEWGSVPPLANRAQVVAGLFGRNRRLTQRAAAIVALPHGSCNGTAFTIRAALERGIPVTVYSWDADTGTFKPALTPWAALREAIAPAHSRPRIQGRAQQISLFKHPAPA